MFTETACQRSGQRGLTLIELIVFILIVSVGIFGILAVIQKAIGLRVSKETEIEGLDVGLHGEVVP